MAEEDEDQREDENQDAEGGDGENAEGEGEGEESGGFDARKIILFVVAPLVLLLAIGGGLYFTGMLDSLLGKEPAHAEGEAGAGEHGDGHDDGHGKKKSKSKDKGHGKKKKDDGHGGGHGDGHGGDGAAFLAIPTMIVNLSSEDGAPRYLRLSVQLEMENQDDMHAVELVIPRVVDQFQTYLRELRVKDLRGSAGIYRLQMELLWRVNQAAAPVTVKDVLFQEILIQ